VWKVFKTGAVFDQTLFQKDMPDGEAAQAEAADLRQRLANQQMWHGAERARQDLCLWPSKEK
jgi:hypothetical protein